MVIFHKVNLDLTNIQIKNLLGNGVHFVYISDETLIKMNITNKLIKGLKLKLNNYEHNETMQHLDSIGQFFQILEEVFKMLQSQSLII